MTFGHYKSKINNSKINISSTIFRQFFQQSLGCRKGRSKTGKDVLKQKGRSKTENDVLKQKIMFHNRKGRSKTEYFIEPIIALLSHFVPKSVQKCIMCSPNLKAQSFSFMHNRKKCECGCDYQKLRCCAQVRAKQL